MAVKVPVFSFEKLHGVDTQFGPEMKSTGEVLGIAPNYHDALLKGLIGAGYTFKTPGPASCCIFTAVSYTHLISGKGLTLHGQYGNKGERLWETPSGLINSIGLQNPGVQHFIDVELNEMLELKQKYGTVAIANLGGHSEEEYVEGAALLLSLIHI